MPIWESNRATPARPVAGLGRTRLDFYSGILHAATARRLPEPAARSWNRAVPAAPPGARPMRTSSSMMVSAHCTMCWRAPAPGPGQRSVRSTSERPHAAASRPFHASPPDAMSSDAAERARTSSTVAIPPKRLSHARCEQRMPSRCGRSSPDATAAAYPLRPDRSARVGDRGELNGTEAGRPDHASWGSLLGPE